MADAMSLRLRWPRMSLMLSKVQGVIVVSPREPVEVRKVLLAHYWSDELLITPLHQAPKHLTQKHQATSAVWYMKPTSQRRRPLRSLICKPMSMALRVGTRVK